MFQELKKRYWRQYIWSGEYFCGTVGEVDEGTIKNIWKCKDKEEKDDNFEIMEE